MPNPHIVIDTNEIRMTDDDGAPSLHILRPAVLAGETYYWFPQCYTPTGATRINSDTLMSSGLTAAVQGSARYKFEAVLSLKRTNGSVAVYYQIDMPAGSDGQSVYHLPIATAWGAKDVNSDSGNIGSLSVSTREILTIKGWVYAGADGTLDLKMRINATDLAAFDYYDVLQTSFITLQRIA